MIAIKSHGSQDVEGDRIQTSAVVESNTSVQVSEFIVPAVDETENKYAVLA